MYLLRLLLFLFVLLGTVFILQSNLLLFHVYHIFMSLPTMILSSLSTWMVTDAGILFIRVPNSFGFVLFQAIPSFVIFHFLQRSQNIHRFFIQLNKHSKYLQVWLFENVFVSFVCRFRILRYFGHDNVRTQNYLCC